MPVHPVVARQATAARAARKRLTGESRMCRFMAAIIPARMCSPRHEGAAREGSMEAGPAERVSGLLDRAVARLGPEGRTDAEWLLGHALDRSRAWLFSHADDRVDAQAAARFAS